MMMVTMNMAAINGRHTAFSPLNGLKNIYINRVPPTDKSNIAYSSFYQLHKSKWKSREQSQAERQTTIYAQA